MPHLSVNPSSKPNCSTVWLISVLLGLLAVHTNANDVLTVPQQVSLSTNMDSQQLSISWLAGAATTFDLMILRTELNENVFYETVSVMVSQLSGRHEWNWTSVEPLQCTSLSIKIRSREGQSTSEWSNTEILQGSDLPSEEECQVFPLDRVVPVGANTTFCCIVKEGNQFGSINYGKTVMNTTRLSRRSYATTVVNQGLSGSSGTNVVCYNNFKGTENGVVVFVGYPPLPSDFVCETHDLTSADIYFELVTEPKKECRVDHWEGNWTLVVVNPLGQYSLTDSAELSHRVTPVAPENLTSVAHATNATVLWQWKYDGYSSLALVCQVELTSQGYKTNHTFSGVGLRAVVLPDLYPYEDYSVQVRCGAQQNFWKWGSWSETMSFKTSSIVPEAPDMWVWMNKDYTGQVIWKPLTRRQSRGLMTGYEVTLWSPEESLQHTEILPPDTFAVPVNLTQMATASSDNMVMATAVYTDSGFFLFWQSDVNTTCAYVVEWHNASCKWNCPVDWIKVAPGNTNVSIESANFQPGVRYDFSLYSSSSEAPELLQRWQGYMQELANLSDPGSRSYTVKSLSEGSYKFTVKAYTSAGEDTGATASIMLEPFTDWLILEILASLGVTALFLVIVTFLCYKKRKWVKKAFYPDIPEPKLPGDWSRSQAPLDVKPPHHSLVHMVERPEWDSSKEALVVIPEEDEDEDGQGIGDELVDTDEPTSLRYYNQVVDERPIRPRYPDSSDSSASSLDSARTDVTYTGIQTSGSSFVFQLDPQGSSEGHQPQADPSSVQEEGEVTGPRCNLESLVMTRAQRHPILFQSPRLLVATNPRAPGKWTPRWTMGKVAAVHPLLVPPPQLLPLSSSSLMERIIQRRNDSPHHQQQHG
ncbi:Leukemia inhibitory factor receptor [Dissostichus eleginoides]|uniref:Leukemia inhibitory factor receptor n=1 Tax=Dissostichus eleginoides TaxID=100907 RepID=A0AAD9C181_DISEL|nr:Leukemia inhibitory factor receptor [Dissostichus eleginoides]